MMQVCLREYFVEKDVNARAPVVADMAPESALVPTIAAAEVPK